MWRVSRWALLFFCLLQSVPGRFRLAPPRNVTLLSENFTVYLTWLPGLGNPPNVTYFVTYQGYPSFEPWRKVEQCAGTTALVCPMMCLKNQDLYRKFRGQVRAVHARGRSPWTVSPYLEYFFKVMGLAPPTLVLTLTEKILWVNATYQLPPCVPSLDLKYDVEFWKEGEGHKTPYPVNSYDQPVKIPLPKGANGRHCLSARTYYPHTEVKYSPFSEPSCIFLEDPGAIWALLTLLLGFPLLVAAAAAGVIWKKLEGDPWFQWVKRPQALDFTEYRYPMAAFLPSEPEFTDDLVLCPQKELTIKTRSVPPVRDPGTPQEGPEEDSTEDEDEDTDDSDSLQPYLERPLFVRKKLQTMGHSEADESGVDSGRSEDTSTWDSSDRSWSSTVNSSLKDDAGSSSCLDKKEPDQEPGGDGHQEALPCLAFSEDLGTAKELLNDELFRRNVWDSLSPKRDLVLGEPPVSLQTLTFSLGSYPEEEEGEEEEEEEEEDGWESEPKGSVTSCWNTSSLQRTEVRDEMLGDYMAR